MFNDDKPAIVASLASLSLDKLAQFAVEEALIDRFEVAGSDTTIIQGDQQFRLPHRQASTFLIGMLRGRSWYVDDPCGNVSTSDQSTDPIDDSPIGSPPEASEEGRSLAATLDGLLTFAQNTGIIREYRKDPDDRTVQIDIAACSSVFTYVEAVSYLFDCVQHEVRTTTEAA